MCRILLLGIFAILVLSPPGTYAQSPCFVQNVNYDVPSSVAVGKQITVKTHITATCVQWPPYGTEYSIRVDLTDLATGFVLSSTTYQVGYAQTYIDQVFLNNATAPNSPGTWSLRVDAYIWMGSSALIVHMTDYAKLPVR
jgi:hypothetical protein